MGVGLVFGLANVALGWLLELLAGIILFLPGLLTLGLLWLLIPVIVNMVLLKIADGVTGDDLKIDSFTGLIGLSLSITVGMGALKYLM